MGIVDGVCSVCRGHCVEGRRTRFAQQSVARESQPLDSRESNTQGNLALFRGHLAMSRMRREHAFVFRPANFSSCPPRGDEPDCVAQSKYTHIWNIYHRENTGPGDDHFQASPRAFLACADNGPGDDPAQTVHIIFTVGDPSLLRHRTRPQGYVLLHFLGAEREWVTRSAMTADPEGQEQPLIHGLRAWAVFQVHGWREDRERSLRAAKNSRGPVEQTRAVVHK